MQWNSWLHHLFIERLRWGAKPRRGVLYLQRLVGIRMFSLLFSKTNPNRPLEPPPFSNLPTATCATNAVPDTLSGRIAARSRAAVAASNRPISILFQRRGWPTAVWTTSFVCPLRARRMAQPLVGILIFFPKNSNLFASACLGLNDRQAIMGYSLDAFLWVFDVRPVRRPAGGLDNLIDPNV